MSDAHRMTVEELVAYAKANFPPMPVAWKYTTGGTFDLAKWKAKMDSYRPKWWNLRARYRQYLCRRAVDRWAARIRGKP